MEEVVINTVERSIRKEPSNVKNKVKPSSIASKTDKCSTPYMISSKILREGKYNMCRHLQNSLLVLARSTKKMLKNMLEEQQSSLDILSNQVAIETLSKLTF